MSDGEPPMGGLYQDRLTMLGDRYREARIMLSRRHEHAKLGRRAHEVARSERDYERASRLWNEGEEFTGWDRETKGGAS